MKLINKKNPWDQSYSVLLSVGEFLWWELRIWQWIALFVIILMGSIVFLIDFFKVINLPNLLHFTGFMAYVGFILMPYGGLTGFLEWFGWHRDDLRRADQPTINTLRMGITLQILVRFTNSVSLAWLFFFPDYTLHLENQLPASFLGYVFYFGLLYLVFWLFDKHVYVFRRFMVGPVLAAVLLVSIFAISVMWWWKFEGLVICPNFLPVLLCDFF